MLRVTIIERESGWVRDDDPSGTIYGSAVAAFESVKKGDLEISQASGETIVRMIEWAPTTRIGLAVVKTLCGMKVNR